MSHQTKTTINALVEELHDAAANVSGVIGSMPSQVALDRLAMAVIAFEDAVIVNGKWQLECVLGGK